MCDTMYAAAGGSAWFAKNSDRNPAEPQALCLVGRRAPSDRARAGARSLPCPDSGYAFLLSKPSWMAGGEMGLNERGVAIGNEAVFSRFPAAKDGVLGMDILRSALGAAGSAREAVEAICAVTEAVDQGGNGAYKGTLRYCNSYLAADPREAFVVETAGRRWAWKQVEGAASISNAYGIGTDYKRLDAATRKEIAPVNERMACLDEADAGRIGEKGSWRAYVEDRLRLRFTKGEARRATTLAALEAAGTELDLAKVLGALRSHGPFDPSRPGRRHMESVCMHAGGLLNNATTASLAVEFLPAPEGGARAVAWFSGTSYPCLSLFKPVLLSEGAFAPLWGGYDFAEGAPAAYAYWEAQRAWIAAGRGRAALGLDPDFVALRDALQGRIVLAAAGAAGGGPLDRAIAAVDAAASEWDAYLREQDRA